MRVKNPERIRAKREQLEATLRELQELERAHTDQRAAIIGRAVLAAAELDPAFRDQLSAILDQFVTASKERKLVGLGASARSGRRRTTEPAAAERVLDLEQSGV